MDRLGEAGRRMLWPPVYSITRPMTDHHKSLAVYLPFNETLSATCSDAINAARANPRVEVAKADSARLHGATLIGASVSQTSLTFALDNSAWLRFFIAALTVEWEVTNSPPEIEKGDASDLVLRFESSNTDLLWKRRELLNQRIGKRVTGLFPGTEWLYFYVDDSPILLLQRMVDVSSDQDWLFWSNTE